MMGWIFAALLAAGFVVYGTLATRERGRLNRRLWSVNAAADSLRDRVATANSIATTLRAALAEEQKKTLKAVDELAVSVKASERVAAANSKLAVEAADATKNADYWKQQSEQARQECNELRLKVQECAGEPAEVPKKTAAKKAPAKGE